ncbi:Uncharacterised protein [Segatella copri]|nr:Uncharacterised protein [Segatella copri]
MCRNAIHENGTLLLAEQSADEVEQGALACTILTEQAINVVLLEFQREISKYKVLATWVSEINVFNLYHNL